MAVALAPSGERRCHPFHSLQNHTNRNEVEIFIPPPATHFPIPNDAFCSFVRYVTSSGQANFLGLGITVWSTAQKYSSVLLLGSVRGMTTASDGSSVNLVNKPCRSHHQSSLSGQAQTREQCGPFGGGNLCFLGQK